MPGMDEAVALAEAEMREEAEAFRAACGEADPADPDSCPERLCTRPDAGAVDDECGCMG